MIGAKEAAEECGARTVFEKATLRPLDKRKRSRNNDPSDIEGFLGPWGGYVDERRVAKPSEEEAAELEEVLAKRSKRGKETEEKPLEEKTVLHSKVFIYILEQKKHAFRARSFSSFTHVSKKIALYLSASLLDCLPLSFFLPPLPLSLSACLSLPLSLPFFSFLTSLCFSFYFSLSFCVSLFACPPASILIFLPYFLHFFFFPLLFIAFFLLICVSLCFFCLYLYHSFLLSLLFFCSLLPIPLHLSVSLYLFCHFFYYSAFLSLSLLSVSLFTFLCLILLLFASISTSICLLLYLSYFYLPHTLHLLASLCFFLYLSLLLSVTLFIILCLFCLLSLPVSASFSFSLPFSLLFSAPLCLSLPSFFASLCTLIFLFHFLYLSFSPFLSNLPLFLFLVYLFLSSKDSFINFSVQLKLRERYYYLKYFGEQK